MLGFAPLGTTALGELPDSNATVIGSLATFTITGQDVSLTATRLLTASVGAFTITGNDIDFRRVPSGLRVISGGGARGLRANAGGGGKGLRIRA